MVPIFLYCSSITNYRIKPTSNNGSCLYRSKAGWYQLTAAKSNCCIQMDDKKRICNSWRLFESIVGGTYNLGTELYHLFLCKLPLECPTESQNRISDSCWLFPSTRIELS